MIISVDGVVVQELTLEKARTTLGRRPYNDIVIDNLLVSGEHAVVHLIDGEAHLEDLKSTNGTSLNAQPVTNQVMQHNDLFKIGSYKIRYLAMPARPEAMAAPDGAEGANGSSTVPTVPEVLSGSPAESTSPETPPAPDSSSTLKILSGYGRGRDVLLQEVITTIDSPGGAVATITRELDSYWLKQVNGLALLNSALLGAEAVALKNGDIFEFAGRKIRFEQT